MSTLCPINPPGHDWENSLTCRCGATRTAGEAIVDGLASRRGGDEAAADALLDTYRTGVLAEVTAWLMKKAREFRAHGAPAQADTASVLASKVSRGAVRPDNLRMLPANSFESGRTYACGPWRFRCDTVTTHPDGGIPVALGWIRGDGSGGWSPYSYELAQWSADWTDVTDGGAR